MKDVQRIMISSIFDASSNEMIKMANIMSAQVPPIISLLLEGNFYGLNEKIVAAESCWFAAKVNHLFIYCIFITLKNIRFLVT